MTLKKHDTISVKFGGLKSLTVCGLSTLAVSPPSPFINSITPDYKTIASKSRKYNTADQEFITSETQKMLAEGIIEASTSPWRAQILVTTNERHKKRLVIDYSQIINRFTQLTAYPLPRIDNLVNKVANYRYFSTLDLRSAYHQIPLSENDKLYTAFEAGGRLYQFSRMPFGITNGISYFQKIMDEIISGHALPDTFSYLDDITICGKNQRGA